MFVYKKMYNEVQSSVIYSLGEFCGGQVPIWFTEEKVRQWKAL